MIRRSAWLLLFIYGSFTAQIRAGSSNSLMDVLPDGTLIVANTDNGTVSILDTTARKVLHEIKMGGKPEGVTWIGQGPLAAVTVYREDAVILLDTREGKIVQKIKVPNEPYGIVANSAGTRLWVTCDYPGLVCEIDPAKREVVGTWKAGQFLRGIALAPGEERLYLVEFYSGVLHAFDLKEKKVVDSWKGHSTDNLARNVVLHPRRPKAYVSHIRSKIDVIDGSGSIFPQLSICTLVPSKDTKRRTSIGMDSYNNLRVVTNPWEAALSPDGKLLYTIYAATNDGNINRVVDDDYQEIERVSAVNLGRNPRAVRVSPDGKTVYVYNALDFTVSIHDANLRLQATVKVCDPPKTPEWVRGKVLFSQSFQPMTGPRWIACSSCHPDGLTDGRVWQNPEGLRKTPAFFGLAHTHPLHWSADRDEVQDFEYTIRGRLMQGRGLVAGGVKPKRGFAPVELDQQLAGRSADLDALAVYTNSFEFNFLSPHIPAPGKLSESAQRGKTLFFSKAIGCAECHSGPYYSDSNLQKPFRLHDVGTGNDDPGEKMGPKYDTPTLLGVYRTAPYLHHGKAKTLRDVLTTCNKEDRHGKTSHLKSEEIDDLVEFLRSLPYEHPPLETANTVKYRVPPKKKE